MKNSLLLIAAMLAAGCNGSTGHSATASASPPPAPAPQPPSPPAPPPVVPPTSAQTYVISPIGSTTVTGPVGTYDPTTRQWSGILALAVEVTLNGQPVDGVTVDFQSYTPNLGPWGLGTMTSGFGYWSFAGPGTGIAAVDAVPAVLGSVQVWAQVITTQGSGTYPASSSNVVVFTVTGQ